MWKMLHKKLRMEALNRGLGFELLTQVLEQTEIMWFGVEIQVKGIKNKRFIGIYK